MSNSILWFNDINRFDIEKVGGKNASLGEMICHLTSLGIKVPNGFATTSVAFFSFLEHSGLDRKIKNTLEKLDIENVTLLAETVGKFVNGFWKHL